jgi:integrase
VQRENRTTGDADALSSSEGNLDAKTRPATRRRRRVAGCVTEKRGRWYAVLTLGPSESGIPQRHWSHAFKSRREAEHHLAQLLIEGRQAKATSHTVGEILETYIARDVTSRGKRSPTTTVRYRGLASNARPIHHLRVDVLPGARIEAMYQELLEKGLSGTTVHHVHNLLRAAFRWAHSRKIGLITRDPIEVDEVDTPARARSDARSLTVVQAQTALKAMKVTKFCNALVFALATAVRRGECCGLRWPSVDLTRQIALICESRYQIPGECGQKPTKADRIREIPLNQTALRALEAERVRQQRMKRAAGDAWMDSGHVFTDELGAPLSPMALTNAFRYVALKAKLPTTRMHHLRHTAATFILSAGGNPAAAAQILGHSEKATTLKIYAHVLTGDSARAAEAIDTYLDSAAGKNGRRPRNFH